MEKKETQVKNLKYGQMIEIVWHDAWTNSSSWTRNEVKNKLQQPLELSSIGYFVDSSEHGVAIAEQITKTVTDPDSQSIHHVHVTPHGMIREIHVLRQSKHRDKD